MNHESNMAEQTVSPAPPVNSHNEWDLLEEVIVGWPRGARIDELDPVNRLLLDEHENEPVFRGQARPYPEEDIRQGSECIEAFCRILESEGVQVRRPDVLDTSRAFATPYWSSRCGQAPANPRDVLMVVGEQIIESATPRRQRRYEVDAYRTLLKQYARAGARWVAPPRPMVTEDLFPPDIDDPRLPRNKFGTTLPRTEWEPVFECADFMRCGRDIFFQESFVTNRSGIQWLQIYLGSEYRFHEIHPKNQGILHIDTTFIPLAPGKAMANPDFVGELPAILNRWDILWPKKLRPFRAQNGLRWCSSWMGLNVLSIDERRVCVDARQEGLMQELRDFGFEPIPVPIEDHYQFHGGLHCVTVDVRRRGTLQSYF